MRLLTICGKRFENRAPLIFGFIVVQDAQKIYVGKKKQKKKRSSMHPPEKKNLDVLGS